MGVVNTLSAAITNADAVPIVKNSRGTTKGKTMVAVGTVEVADTDEATSVYRLVRVPSNAIIETITAFSDDLEANVSPTLLFDCGLYQTAANGRLVADQDCFAVDSTLGQATSTTGVSLRFDTADINGITKRAYEMLALTADSQREYDLCLTLKAAASTPAAGTLTLIVKYTV